MDAKLVKDAQAEEICPRCRIESRFPNGKYIDLEANVGAILKFFKIIPVPIPLRIRFQYCAGCGFLKVPVRVA